MKKRYDHQAIESKWQKNWEEQRVFRAEPPSEKPKYYVLDMFPYPSGAGLHVGHVEGYTATDAIARYKRQKGFNVLHPMGWDSFGLPAEQYAIRTGTHPAETTKKNIDTFRRQLKSLGFSYDWEREIATSDAKYYKWTQWIFTVLYNKGLAYEAKVLVNYCPNLGTVLANEEVENGKSVEGGHPVERRPLRQWMFKITAYAERLLEDLDLLDWPESIKKLQRNWIGKSEGATVHFQVEDLDEKISVFTTRPDTLFGATYMVLAPEHPLVAKVTTESQRTAVEAYQKKALLKSDLDRTDLAKDKTGIFTGGYALNPVNGEKLPIWISDYVLMGYGTGAIMAVPAHDARDFEFAKAHDLAIRAVFDPDVKAHPELVPENVSPEDVRKQVLSGTLCWEGDGDCINSSNDDLSINGMRKEKAISATTEWLEKQGSGKKSVSYKLRDWLFSRQRYWGEPFPILHLEDGSKRVLDLDELPLCPPEVSDYAPSGDGQSPLSKVKEWVETTDPKSGKPARRETNTMPQWAGSCWYYLRFIDPHNDEKFVDPELEKYWMPIDLYVGGVEHAVLHLLYARFWHKVLYDCGFVSTPEPFASLRNQGLIVARAYQKEGGGYAAPEDVQEKDKKFFIRETGEEVNMLVEKMSKSKLNGVSPDEIIEEFGADSLRLYELFMGPLEKEKIWNTDAVSGCYRFLKRFYELCTSDKVSDENSEEALKLGHRLVDGVGKDYDSLMFNTAIAKMMEFINAFSKLPSYPREVLSIASQALMPLAPHMAEECWELLGRTEELTRQPWPKVDQKYLVEDTITYVVQVNGKLRGRLELPKGLEEVTVIDEAMKLSPVTKHVNGKEIRKRIFVQDKLLNLVVG